MLEALIRRVNGTYIAKRVVCIRKILRYQRCNQNP